MQDSVVQKAEALANKVKHYLITSMGITLEEATDEEFYRAFGLSFREEIMINWTATQHTIHQVKPRMLYYLCMEYMPGRLFENNIANIHAQELVQRTVKLLGRDLNRVLMMESDPGLGNGGLGRLASCFLDSLATRQYPAIAYGLRYQYGVFAQEVCAGRQVERPEIWLLNENPWEFRKDIHAVSVFYAGQPISVQNGNGSEVYDLVGAEEVRALAYDIPIIGYRATPDFNVVTLRLWTTKESPRNFELQRFNAGLLDEAAENTSLTDVLYPSDNNEFGKRMRLKQEFLLASASVQDIVHSYLKHNGSMTGFAERVRIHINDTHPVLAIVELLHILLKDYHYTWPGALEMVQNCFNYTNHTVLREALEEWNIHRVRYLLPRHAFMIERLNWELCQKVRAKYPNDEERVRRMSIIENGGVRMANLAIYGCYRVNGVAALHTEILKKDIFKDFYEMFPEKFENITNGVTQRRWLYLANPLLSEFITERIGPEWIYDFEQIRKLESFARDEASQKQFLEIKRENKRRLLLMLKKENPVRNEEGVPIDTMHLLDEHALFDVQIKRFHEYKRQLLNVMHTIMLYQELQANPAARKVKRMVLIGGKAAPAYITAKNVIQLIACLSRTIAQNAEVRPHLSLAFIENYNVSRAEVIIPAADLSEQISCAGLEASGTGNMKLAINGALTIGTEDGANVEIHQAVTDHWWPFGFGNDAATNRRMHKEGSYRPWDIYHNVPRIKKAVDSLKRGDFAKTEQEAEAMLQIYRALLEPTPGENADKYFILADLVSYYETQKKVEELYAQPQLWAEYALQNISRMGHFSTDYSIENYAKLVWGLKPCPVDRNELTRVAHQYSEYDKCRILAS